MKLRVEALRTISKLYYRHTELVCVRTTINHNVGLFDNLCLRKYSQMCY